MQKKNQIIAFSIFGRRVLNFMGGAVLVANQCWCNVSVGAMSVLVPDLQHWLVSNTDFWWNNEKSVLEQSQCWNHSSNTDIPLTLIFGETTKIQCWRQISVGGMVPTLTLIQHWHYTNTDLPPTRAPLLILLSVATCWWQIRVGVMSVL